MTLCGCPSPHFEQITILLPNLRQELDLRKLNGMTKREPDADGRLDKVIRQKSFRTDYPVRRDQVRWRKIIVRWAIWIDCCTYFSENTFIWWISKLTNERLIWAALWPLWDFLNLITLLFGLLIRWTKLVWVQIVRKNPSSQLFLYLEDTLYLIQQCKVKSYFTYNKLKRNWD